MSTEKEIGNIVDFIDRNMYKLLNCEDNLYDFIDEYDVEIGALGLIVTNKEIRKLFSELQEDLGEMITYLGTIDVIYNLEDEGRIGDKIEDISTLCQITDSHFLFIVSETHNLKEEFRKLQDLGLSDNGRYSDFYEDFHEIIEDIIKWSMRTHDVVSVYMR